MKERDTATIGLTRGEAQEVINALSNYEVTVSGREEEQVLNVRELLKREFDFEESDFEGRGRGSGSATGLVDAVTDIFDADDEHEVQLSRFEAAEIVTALDDFEEESGSAGSIRDVRSRIEETFDLPGGAV